MNINSLAELASLKTILKDSIEEGVGMAITSFSNETIGMCPKNTGATRESYEVKVNDNLVHKGENVNIVKVQLEENNLIDFSYNTDYASNLHKGLNSGGYQISNWTTPGTGPGFLETPFSQIEEEVFAQIMQSLGRRGI